MVKKTAAFRVVRQRPAHRVHDKALLVFFRLDFPYFLEPNSIALRVGMFSQVVFIDQFLAEIASAIFSAESNSTSENTNIINYKLDINDLGFLYAISKELKFEGELKAKGNIKGKLNSPKINFESDISNFNYIIQ